MNTQDIDIPQNSRFFGGEMLLYSSGVSFLEAKEYQRPESLEFETHLVKESETIQAIAAKYYNKIRQDGEHFFWLICYDNNIGEPYNLSDWVGKYIRIPDLHQYLLNR